MKKAKFTEATQQLESVKTQVALCIQEFGINNIVGNCTNGKDGFGWEIKADTAYATKYVAKIEVNPIKNGSETNTSSTQTGLLQVTATAANAYFGNGTKYTLILDGDWTAAGQLDWKVNSKSKCIKAKLCGKGATNSLT